MPTTSRAHPDVPGRRTRTEDQLPAQARVDGKCETTHCSPRATGRPATDSLAVHDHGATGGRGEAGTSTAVSRHLDAEPSPARKRVRARRRTTKPITTWAPTGS